MFQIKIQALEFFGYHGVHEQERTEGQMFEVDVVLDIEKLPAGDELPQTVDYVAVVEEILAINQSNTFHLLETFAKVVIKRLFEKFAKVERIEMCVRKRLRLEGAKLHSVVVSVDRTRTEV